MTKKIIAILEDDSGRVSAMRDRLNELFSDWAYIFFNNAPDMIEWLETHLSECIVISLDHDLGPSWKRDGELFDPGTGRDVVDYLVTKSPQCPLIIHSSNAEAVIGMEMALTEVNWQVERVIPFVSLGSLIGSAEWIDTDWTETINRLLKRHYSESINSQTIDSLEPIIDRKKTLLENRLIIVLDDSEASWKLTQLQLDEVFPSRSSLWFSGATDLMAWLSEHLAGMNLSRNARQIAILDNSKQRIEQMRHQLQRFSPNWLPVFFDNAPEAIAWFSENLHQCDLISLDYNLGPTWTRENQRFDPGTGRDVVDYLATQSPQCPIIFHNSRSETEIGMEIGLIDTAWIFERVPHSPFLAWISQDWVELVQLFLNAIAPKPLTLDDIPDAEAEWAEINYFALSFDGYRYWQSVEACIQLGKYCAQNYHISGILPDSIAELRTGLLVERNRWRRSGIEPDDPSMQYIQAILTSIRLQLCNN